MVSKLISDDRPLPPDSINDSLSTSDLRVICQRFKTLHSKRLQSIQDLLLPEQRPFLDLLPLLFHLNNPLLPGFCSTKTPAGIAHYQPTVQTINAAEQLSETFNNHQTQDIGQSIQGVFLMGSVSSIAFTQTSDIDIWICHAPDVSTEALDNLQNKATNIENWAGKLNLEVHFFIIDSEQFKQGQDTPISTESSGKTQHYLLLEEFYRTGIYIAGKVPAWWLVPADEESRYNLCLQQLLQKNPGLENEIIDFGGLGSVPAEEFISATLWHLYKSINAPHKSLLKLMLIECYASEFPAPEWLSQQSKKAIYQNNYDLNDLDPYLLIYQRVERYLLNNGEEERLPLAQHCFFLKIMGTSVDNKVLSGKRRREAFLEFVAQQHNWSKKTLTTLNQKKSWDINKATKEHKIIMQQLIQCFRKTMGFASRHVGDEYRENSDYKLIGRKLFSTLERKPGKIEIITTRSIIHSREKQLSIMELTLPAGGVGWGLYLGILTSAEQTPEQPIKTGWNLIEILCWLVINGLYHRKLELCFTSSTLNFPQQELHLLLRKLEHFLTRHLAGITDNLEVYKETNHYFASLNFINLGLSDTLPPTDDSPFSGEHPNKQNYSIQTIDRISISTWGEVTVNRYQGLEGLISCLIDTINAYKGPVADATRNITCYSLVRSNISKLRIYKVFSHLVELFTNPETTTSTRYFLPADNSYFLLQRLNGVLSYALLTNENMILAELARPQIDFSQVYFDINVLKQNPIPYFYTYNRPQTIQLFAMSRGTSVLLYIIDERGSLCIRQHDNTDPRQLLTAYSVFLETVLTRGMLDYFLTLEYFLVKTDSEKRISCKRVHLDPAPIWQYLNIRITGEEFNNRQTNYTIYCNEQEFSPMIYGDDVFTAASEYIFNLRRSKDHYPIHITDIDVPYSTLGASDPDSIQTLHLLQYKQEIEELLNKKVS